MKDLAKQKFGGPVCGPGLYVVKVFNVHWALCGGSCVRDFLQSLTTGFNEILCLKLTLALTKRHICLLKTVFSYFFCAQMDVIQKRLGVFVLPTN